MNSIYKSLPTLLLFAALISLTACGKDELGVAAAPDLCIDVECPAQNEGFCDGNTVVKVAGEGECLAHNGLCDYSLVETQVDCAADGMVCSGVECVNLCADVLCPELAPYCRNNTQISYAEAGICDWRTGGCHYSNEIDGLNCEDNLQVCEDGSCVDLCADTLCPQPATECLNSDSLIEYSDVGSCDWQDGSCFYDDVQSVTQCSDNLQICTNGACVDLCADVQCPALAPYCHDNTQISYAEVGVCDWHSGECNYSNDIVSIECEDSQNVCNNGACIDLCESVSCPQPDTQCLDDTSLVEYSDVGSCEWQNGSCNYENVQSITNCNDSEHVCNNGSCINLCENTTCPQPDALCLSSANLIEYSADGSCDWQSGACSYDDVQTIIDCNDSQQVCESGACVDLCADVVCAQPGAYCLGDDTEIVVSYSSEGLCLWENARCDYSQVESRKDCLDFGGVCEAGECISPPMKEGDLVITEILFNSSGDDLLQEWFEIHNATELDIDIEGVTISDNSIDSFTISNGGLGAVIPAHGYFILGVSDDTSENNSVNVDYVYERGLFNLSNTDDEIIIELGDGTMIDTVEYITSSYPGGNGVSMSLLPTLLTAADNDVAASWFSSCTVWTGSSGDQGTPGEANVTCP